MEVRPGQGAGGFRGRGRRGASARDRLGRGRLTGQECRSAAVAAPGGPAQDVLQVLRQLRRAADERLDPLARDDRHPAKAW